MHVDVTGIVAVGGFWAFGIAMALKKPLTRLIERRKTKDEDVKRLNEKIEHLESMLSTVHQEMLEMKESNEFSQKLLTGGEVLKIKTEQQSSDKSIAASAPIGRDQ